MITYDLHRPEIRENRARHFVPLYEERLVVRDHVTVLRCGDYRAGRNLVRQSCLAFKVHYAARGPELVPPRGPGSEELLKRERVEGRIAAECILKLNDWRLYALLEAFGLVVGSLHPHWRLRTENDFAVWVFDREFCNAVAVEEDLNAHVAS